jgi:hypothetical protein
VRCRAASTNNVMTVPFRRLLTVLSTLIADEVIEQI